MLLWFNSLHLLLLFVSCLCINDAIHNVTSTVITVQEHANDDDPKGCRLNVGTEGEIVSEIIDYSVNPLPRRARRRPSVLLSLCLRSPHTLRVSLVPSHRGSVPSAQPWSVFSLQWSDLLSHPLWPVSLLFTLVLFFSYKKRTNNL